MTPEQFDALMEYLDRMVSVRMEQHDHPQDGRRCQSREKELEGCQEILRAELVGVEDAEETDDHYGQE